MKYSVILLLAISLFSFKGEKKGFKIEGSLEGYEDGTVVYLRNLNCGLLDNFPANDDGYTDSTIIKKGLFSFNGKLEYPQRFVLQTQNEIESNIHDYKPFWIDNSQIIYKAKKGNLENAEIIGSDIQRQQDEFELIISSEMKVMKTYISYVNNGDTLNLKKHKCEKEEAVKEIRNKEKEFIKNKPEYLYSAILLSNLKYDISKKETKVLFSCLTDEIQNSFYGKEIANYINN